MSKVKSETGNKSQDDYIRNALNRIAEIARDAANGGEAFEDYSRNDNGEESGEETPGCVIKSLPTRLLVPAAETARSINPANAPLRGRMAAAGGEFTVDDPMRIAVLTSKYWGPAARTLTVSFMESTPANLRARIVSHLNAWTRTSGIAFAETGGTGQIRISRGPGGYWSYLGTDVLHIPRNRPTMNLEGFTMNTSESEYKRVVRHEAGHTLGFPHEHMRRELVARIDRDRAYQWFWQQYGWDRATVDSQVLTPLSDASIMGTPADQTSIMCYQLPGAITRDGRPIVGGNDINRTDYAFAGRIYPRSGQATGRRAAAVADWDESEDVEVELEVEA